MRKYNCLLEKIAATYGIKKGLREQDNELKARIIYSVCGMMAYASLWDNMEDEPISMVHMKRRIHNILKSYLVMYPETRKFFPADLTDVETEITDLFVRVGIIYHSPRQISPAIQSASIIREVLFQRGIQPEKIEKVSGIGFYSLEHKDSSPLSPQKMFGLNEHDLATIWSRVISKAIWQENKISISGAEYLSLAPLSGKKYWWDKVDKSGRVSILRFSEKLPHLYYLYAYTENNIKLSQLPSWMVDNGNYRQLAAACLYSREKLPSIEYCEDGSIVHIDIKYLLPPRELNWIKLYSWPERGAILPSNFKRKCNKEIFVAIKMVLENMGYSFKQKE